MLTEDLSWKKNGFILYSLSSYRCKDVELFSWKTTYNKDHLEACLPNSRLLISGLFGMWSSMKITLCMLDILCKNDKFQIEVFWH